MLRFELFLGGNVAEAAALAASMQFTAMYYSCQYAHHQLIRADTIQWRDHGSDEEKGLMHK